MIWTLKKIIIINSASKNILYLKNTKCRFCNTKIAILNKKISATQRNQTKVNSEKK